MQKEELFARLLLPRGCARALSPRVRGGIWDPIGGCGGNKEQRKAGGFNYDILDDASGSAKDQADGQMRSCLLSSRPRLSR
jgi:hypothetical protein